jgi:prepilin-type N-terminal cleavage/methylation domain-containing protein
VPAAVSPRRVRSSAAGAAGQDGVTLLEMMIAVMVAVVVLAGAADWLLSSERAVATTTARSADNASAQRAIDAIDSDLRFATAVGVSSDGGTLYVSNYDVQEASSESSAQVAESQCQVWALSGGDLTEQVSTLSGPATNVIATGVASLQFTGYPYPYDGLVSASLVVDQNPAADKSGAAIQETLSAGNMASPVANSAADTIVPYSCTP